MVLALTFFFLATLVSSVMSWTLSTYALKQREVGQEGLFKRARNRAVLWLSFGVISAIAFTALLFLKSQT